MLDEVAVASLAPLKIYLPLYLNCKIPELLFEDKLPPIEILLLDVIKEKPVPFYSYIIIVCLRACRLNR